MAKTSFHTLTAVARLAGVS